MPDAPGTCHLVGCPGKGTVDQHRRTPIGAADDFTAYQRGTCLGFPAVIKGSPGTWAVCSLRGPWSSDSRRVMRPSDLGRLVDEHRANCTGPQKGTT